MAVPAGKDGVDGAERVESVGGGESTDEHADTGGTVPDFAWRPVSVIAAAAAAILLAIAGRYGYHRDELYFLEAGKHLAWGYDDQPPLTPFLIRIETGVFGDSVQAVRIFPMLFAVGLVYLSALCARELGGTRAAQLIAASATACGPLVLFLGHIFVTANVDYFFWSLILWLLLRRLRTGDDRLWIPIGLAAGLGLLNNNLIAGLAGVLVIGALIAGPRDLLTNRRVLLAALLAVLLWSPYLAWQAQHSWPELKMMKHISSLQDERANMLPFLVIASLLVTPVWITGLWRFARNPSTSAYRLFAWAFAALLAVLLITGGKRYYPPGFFPLFFGSGAVAITDWWDRAADARWRRALTVASIVGTLAVTVATVLPVLPAKTYASSGLSGLNKENGETIGWPQLVATVAAAYATIPADQRSHAVVLAENYGVAGAIAHYGPALGLPFAYAPHDGYNRFGEPASADTGPVVVAGYQDTVPPRFLSGCVRQGVVDNGIGAENQEQGWPVWVCSGAHEDWATLWPTLIHYS